jgi:DNA mismatch repair protein MutS2
MTGARSLDALDWHELASRLAAAAESPAGRARARALALAADAAEARRRMAAVAELAALLEAGETLPSLAAPEIEPALAAAEKAIVLGAEELRPVAAVAALAEGVRRYAAAARGGGPGRPPAPELGALGATLEPPVMLGRVIDESFDASGEISDAASPELARLRLERNGLADHARAAIETIMRSEDYASVLQDQFFTIRAERYVLPLKASAKSLGLGIVHDTSRTGETVFVEPSALVAANNRLKVVELDIRRESRRILEALTGDVAAAAPALRACAATLAVIDASAAAAKLGRAYGGHAVAIVDDASIDLRAGRHPLLALAHGPAEVVANDVALGGGRAPILVVSGPNAGGKTVLMKTVGLAALMARAGLLVAAAPGSRVGFFADVRADIGDRQSVLGDLSTFSGHLANVSDILNAPVGGPTLVLLDELMAGTNPEQGAALARATAETLAERPVLAVLTTHYDSLKALGESDPRFANAGMEYDLDGLRPTFRLALGAPGRSFAFDIAARMGLPPALLERARALTGSSSAGLEAVIARLEAREAEASAAAARLADAEAAARATAQAQEEAADALTRRERELGHKAREAIEAAIAEARAEIRAVVRRAQEAGTGRAAEAARQELERVGADAVAKLPKPETPAPASPAPSAPLAAGAPVFIERLGAEGVLVQPPDARGRAKVALGSMTVEVGADELRPAKARREAPRAGRGGRAGHTPAASAPPPADDELALVSTGTARSVDLRGQTGDDALAAVEAALDRAALDGQSHLVIVHGHGTGALRKRVRAYLDESPYVARWAPGTARQGGDGVSVVELR